MKKLSFLIVLIFVSISIFAHPASKVVLNYDKSTKKLKVEAYHKVKDMSDHYIIKIVVEVNGKEVVSKGFAKQSSLEEQVIEIELPEIKAGDKISVSTTCNKFGKKGGSLVIK
jgi:sulfur carrier protein ThiS